MYRDVEEHDEVKKMVCDAEKTHPSDADYDKMMRKATMMFLQHCQEEENDQLKKLKQCLSAEDNDVRLPIRVIGCLSVYR